MHYKSNEGLSNFWPYQLNEVTCSQWGELKIGKSSSFQVKSRKGFLSFIRKRRIKRISHVCSSQRHCHAAYWIRYTITDKATLPASIKTRSANQQISYSVENLENSKHDNDQHRSSCPRREWSKWSSWPRSKIRPRPRKGCPGWSTTRESFPELQTSTSAKW